MAHKVLQWYLCRMEGWFAADADNISVQSWDEVSCFSLFQKTCEVHGLNDCLDPKLGCYT